MVKNIRRTRRSYQFYDRHRAAQGASRPKGRVGILAAAHHAPERWGGESAGPRAEPGPSEGGPAAGHGLPLLRRRGGCPGSKNPARSSGPGGSRGIGFCTLVLFSFRLSDREEALR